MKLLWFCFLFKESSLTNMPKFTNGHMDEATFNWEKLKILIYLGRISQTTWWTVWTSTQQSWRIWWGREHNNTWRKKKNVKTFYTNYYQSKKTTIFSPNSSFNSILVDVQVITIAGALNAPFYLGNY